MNLNQIRQECLGRCTISSPRTAAGLLAILFLVPLTLNAQTNQVPAQPTSHRTFTSQTSNSLQWLGESPESNSCGCGQPSCQRCMACIPPAVVICPPSQPIGVTSGTYAPCITGVDSVWGPDGKRWRDARGINFQPLQHGEYIGPVRLPAMLEYRVRVNDEFQFTFIVNRKRLNEEYRLMVGDEISINSISDENVKRDKIPIQPDGTIIIPYHGRILGADKTISQLRLDIEEALSKYIKKPAVNVEPVRVNTALEDLRLAVNSQFGVGGASIGAVVNPDGRLQLPLIGGIYVQGMTIDELKREVNLRYAERIIGIEVEPRLNKVAEHAIFVYGEVNDPGRFVLTGPTSVTGGLALAKGLKFGANNRKIIILRRAEDYRMVATMVDLRAFHMGSRPTPSDEIWLRDGDIVVVPPRPFQVLDNGLRQVFTDGIYRVVPIQGISFQR